MSYPCRVVKMGSLVAWLRALHAAVYYFFPFSSTEQNETYRCINQVGHVDRSNKGGMEMAKRKEEKVRGERNFAGKRKIGGKSGMEQKCTCTRDYMDIGEREREKENGAGREKLTGETDLYCAMCSSDVSCGIRM